MFEASLLDQVEERGKKREQMGGIVGEQERDVEEDPDGLDHGKRSAFLAGIEGGHEAKEEADGKNEDAKRDGFVPPKDEQKGQREKKAEEGLGLVGVDREAMMGGIEHLGEGNEVEENGCDGGRDGDVSPPGAIVEGSGQHGERGYAVEEDRDSEPEEGHR